LIGSTTDPVIRNRMIRVETITIVSTIGTCAARLCSRSTNEAVCPATPR